MLFCVFGAIASLIQKEYVTAVQAIVIGFLVSPYGLPMVGTAVIAFLEGINEAIKSI